jgi:6-pyruvoyltetrahydropterin/6-carboxytetrahydropterin synthase
MHRIPGHEGSCKAYHGHRYVAEITVTAAALDHLGRIVDFSVIKTLVGNWIECNFDHTAILHKADPDPSAAAVIEANSRFGKPAYLMEEIPTAENIARELGLRASELLTNHGIKVVTVRLWETPNCSAVWSAS